MTTDSAKRRASLAPMSMRALHLSDANGTSLVWRGKQLRTNRGGEGFEGGAAGFIFYWSLSEGVGGGGVFQSRHACRGRLGSSLLQQTFSWHCPRTGVHYVERVRK